MIWSAFILGILGSVHCAIICGPLMIGVVSQYHSKYSILTHHFGRWIGYVILTGFFQLVVSPLKVFQLQQYVSF
jgi:sulfite exporter TauE/SafE